MKPYEFKQDLDVVHKIKVWLIANNFELGTYGWENPTHTIGFPGGTVVRVKPKYTPIGGACTILVGPTEVFRMALDTPFQNNRWIIRDRYSYSDRERLKIIFRASALI